MIFKIRAASSAIRLSMPDYVIDLDPIHQVLRLTISKVLTDQVVLDAYRSIGRLASQGGPYAAIFDGSEVRDVKLSADTVRSLALGAPAVPAGRPRVVVVNRIVLYGLTRMFESTRTSMGLQFHIVWSVEEAYARLAVSPESFSQRLFPENPVGAGSGAQT
jgi:hypothetical protein